MDSLERQEITPLTKPVCSRLRSAVVIPTFPQILNELVQNSLDAGASRVECWINLERGNEMIRVEDDGHGIDQESLGSVAQDPGKFGAARDEQQAERQGLVKNAQVLIPDRSVPTASWVKVCRVCSSRLTSALASLSAIGLLEITSKIAASRQTYTKIMKVSIYLPCQPL